MIAGLLHDFSVLLRDPAHWAFELFLMAIFDGVVGLLVWPRIKKHIHRDVTHAEQHTAYEDTDPGGDVHDELSASTLEDIKKIYRKETRGRTIEDIRNLYGPDVDDEKGDQMKSMFEGGPYSGKVLNIGGLDDAAYLEIDETGRYDRVGTNEAGLMMFRWATAPDPEETNA